MPSNSGADWFEIDETTLMELRMEMSLIDMHRKTAMLLERDLYGTLKERYGVNLDDDSWELDVQRGVMRRKEQ